MATVACGFNLTVVSDLPKKFIQYDGFASLFVGTKLINMIMSIYYASCFAGHFNADKPWSYSFRGRTIICFRKNQIDCTDRSGARINLKAVSKFGRNFDSSISVLCALVLLTQSLNSIGYFVFSRFELRTELLLSAIIVCFQFGTAFFLPTRGSSSWWFFRALIRAYSVWNRHFSWFLL